jgi:integrase
VRRFDELDLPLSEIWRLWWPAHGRSLSSSSQASYRRIEALSAQLGEHPGTGDIIAWTGMVRGICKSPRSVAAYRARLAALYGFATKAGWVRRNPVAMAPFRRPDPAASVAIRDIRAVWPRLLRLGQTPQERALLGVLRYTGVRINEAMGLMRCDVLPSRRGPWLLSVVRQRLNPDRPETSPTKGRRGHACRAIPIRSGPARARRLLEPLLELEARDPFLFTFRRAELRAFMARIRRSTPALFPLGRAWHVFRHSFAFEFMAKGGALEDLRRLLFGTSIARNVFSRLKMDR